MHLLISITTNFDSDKEEPYLDGGDNFPPQYFPTEMMRDGLNDFLDEVGLGIGSERYSDWSDFFEEHYGWIPSMNVAFVKEIPHDKKNWLHAQSRKLPRRNL